MLTKGDFGDDICTFHMVTSVSLVEMETTHKIRDLEKEVQTNRYGKLNPTVRTSLTCNTFRNLSVFSNQSDFLSTPVNMY